MKKIIIACILIMSTNLVDAQINAITQTGDEVILYENGTWKYVNDTITKDAIIRINSTKFLKDIKSTFLVKSNNVNIGVWINPKEWSFSKDEDSDAVEYEFQKKKDDLYAMLISEKIQVPIETLKGIALDNARSAAPDIKIINEEYRTVNGIKVLMMQMTGTIQGLRFTYFGYYYSNENGTIQLLAYTGENLFKNYEKEIETFLNGLVVIK